MGKAKPYNSKDLTKHLRQLASEAQDWTEEDGVITKGEALARLLWRKALGYTEQTTDDEGNVKEVYHKPEAWAIQLVYERMEGKTPQAIEEDTTRRKAKDEVRDLAKSRVNDLADKALTTGKGPPRHKKKDDSGE